MLRDSPQDSLLLAMHRNLPGTHNLEHPGQESLPLSHLCVVQLSSEAARARSLAAPSHRSASKAFGPAGSATSHGGE